MIHSKERRMKRAKKRQDESYKRKENEKMAAMGSNAPYFPLYVKNTTFADRRQGEWTWSVELISGAEHAKHPLRPRQAYE